jgi:hypothetical protein
MPTYHVPMSYLKKGGHQGGAAGFARYLSRDGRDEASQFRRYLEREGVHQGKDDLVAAGSANLPRWAQGSAAQFWQAAVTSERTGWVVARHLHVGVLPATVLDIQPE